MAYPRYPIESKVYDTFMSRPTLNSASEHGDLAAVVDLVARGANVNSRTMHGHSPLGGAVRAGHLDVVLFLLQHGADANTRTNFGWTPIYIAAWRGHLNICEVLLEKHVSLDHKSIRGPHSPDGFTALHIAAHEGHGDIVDALVKAGANTEQETNIGSTALHVAASRNNVKVLQLLSALGANLNATNHGGRTPLHLAAWEGQFESVSALLKLGANVKLLDDNCASPGGLAKRRSFLNIAQLLSDHSDPCNIGRTGTRTLGNNILISRANNAGVYGEERLVPNPFTTGKPREITITIDSQKIVTAHLLPQLESQRLQKRLARLPDLALLAWLASRDLTAGAQENALQKLNLMYDLLTRKDLDRTKGHEARVLVDLRTHLGDKKIPKRDALALLARNVSQSIQQRLMKDATANLKLLSDLLELALPDV